VHGAWTSLGLSLIFAFCVLLGASRSLRLAGLATLSVGSVVASFMAFAVGTKAQGASKWNAVDPGAQ
jgi:hypothetical protein